MPAASSAVVHGLVALSLESGILLYCNLLHSDEGDFGLGSRQDPYQLAATLFALYSTASTLKEDEEGGSGPSTLRFVSMGRTVLYFCSDVGGGILSVASVDARLSGYKAQALVEDFGQLIASHGLSTTNSPRQSTLKAINRDLNRLLSRAAASALETVKSALCGPSGFVVLIDGVALDSPPDAAFLLALEAAKAANSKQSESQPAASTSEDALAECREAIAALHAKHNPAKLRDLPRLLAEWQGREDVLLAAVRFQYDDDGCGGERDKKGAAAAACGRLGGCGGFSSNWLRRLLARTGAHRVGHHADPEATAASGAAASDASTATTTTSRPEPESKSEPEPAAHVISRSGPAAHARGLDALFTARAWMASTPFGLSALDAVDDGAVLELRLRPPPAPAPVSIPLPEPAAADVIVQDLDDGPDPLAPAPVSAPVAVAVAVAAEGSAGAADCLRMWRLGPLLVVREARGDAHSPQQCDVWALRSRAASAGSVAEETVEARDAALLVVQCLRLDLAIKA